jgi:hypothetical protein
VTVPSPLDVLLFVSQTFERLGIDYVVVGSFASSARGQARATADVDLIADLSAELVPALASALAPDFYLEESAMRRAIAGHRSFNLIHLDSMFKVDVFIPPPTGFRRAQLLHRQREIVAPDPERSVYLATAEDTILAKLQWYEQGGRASERQWSDVLGVIKVQAGRLDLAYLRAIAKDLGLGELLDLAFEQSGISGPHSGRPSLR